MLKDIAKKYYDDNYNCAESIIRAGNEYYGLELHDRDMIMMAGFGGGVQTGSACGAVLSAVGLLAMKYVEAKAHESEIKPITVSLIRRVNEKYGSVDCKVIKPQSFNPEIKCYGTISSICDLLEETLAEYENK